MGFAFVAYVVVKEGSEASSAELEAGVEGGLDDDVEGALGG
jgi:hypothetical protein